MNDRSSLFPLFWMVILLTVPALGAKPTQYLILALAPFALPGVCAAEAVSVTPLDWDFGDLLVGETASTLFRVDSLDDSTPLTVGEITIEEDPRLRFGLGWRDGGG